MKRNINRFIAVAAFAASPAFAGSNFLVDFEKTWDFGNGGVANYYNGGAADDGSSGGPNHGVSFTGVSGLSNDVLGPYYANAPTMQGVAYAYGTAFMNVVAGVDSKLLFHYASPAAVIGAVKAYSGLNGTGTLLGTFDMTANSSTAYDTWTYATLNFSGTAHSFDFSETANVAAVDNIAAVPEPETYAMLLAGLGLLGFVARRRSQKTA